MFLNQMCESDAGESVPPGLCLLPSNIRKFGSSSRRLMTSEEPGHVRCRFLPGGNLCAQGKPTGKGNVWVNFGY